MTTNPLAGNGILDRLMSAAASFIGINATSEAEAESACEAGSNKLPQHQDQREHRQEFPLPVASKELDLGASQQMPRVLDRSNDHLATDAALSDGGGMYGSSHSLGGSSRLHKHKHSISSDASTSIGESLHTLPTATSFSRASEKQTTIEDTNSQQQVSISTEYKVGKFVDTDPSEAVDIESNPTIALSHIPNAGEHTSMVFFDLACKSRTFPQVASTPRPRTKIGSPVYFLSQTPTQQMYQAAYRSHSTVPQSIQRPLPSRMESIDLDELDSIDSASSPEPRETNRESFPLYPELRGTPFLEEHHPESSPRPAFGVALDMSNYEKLFLVGNASPVLAAEPHSVTKPAPSPTTLPRPFGLAYGLDTTGCEYDQEYSSNLSDSEYTFRTTRKRPQNPLARVLSDQGSHYRRVRIDGDLRL